MKRAAMLLAIGPVDEQLQSEPSETTVGQATESDVPFEQHDVVVTTNGTTLGSVRGLSSTENGELVLVANDINEEVLDPVPEFEPGVFDQELQFVCPVDAIVNYEAGVVRVPSDVPEYMQALYYDLVEDALGKTVDNIVEVYENDHKPRLESDNYTAEDLHDVQQSIRRFRQKNPNRHRGGGVR